MSLWQLPAAADADTNGACSAALPPPRLAEVITSHPYNNVTDSIFQKIGVNLHQQPSHPLGILKARLRWVDVERRSGGCLGS